jgi:Tfp pilus assembly protein PilV
MKPFETAGPSRGRSGFTIAETMVTLGLLAVALTLVAQVGVQTLRERERVVAGQVAREQAINVLETARAQPWEKLDAGWAEKQQLPEAYTRKGWKLQVRVEPEASRPRVKRVSVEVRPEETPAPPVRLVGLFAARSAPEKEANP